MTRDTSLRDALLGVLTIALFAMLTLVFDLAERFNRWVAQFEGIQLDELVLGAFFSALVMVWFALRRVAELRIAFAEREQARQRLASLVSENRQLARHTLDVQETERRQMAHEIHDDIGQYLAAIRLGAALLSGNPDTGVTETATRIDRNTAHIQGKLREQLRRLRPVALDAGGIEDALDALIERWRDENPDTLFVLEIAPDAQLQALADETAIAVYRIVQEALTNVSRHAAASRVTISLLQTLDSSPRCLLLQVHDDGQGGQGGSSVRAGFGLLGMRERAHALNGSFECGRHPDGGFLVKASFPRDFPEDVDGQR